MGMFDYVHITCPICGHKFSTQSKGGPCILNSYSIHNAPMDVLGDIIHDKFTCGKCGNKLKIKAVYMAQVIIDDEESEEEE